MYTSTATIKQDMNKISEKLAATPTTEAETKELIISVTEDMAGLGNRIFALLDQLAREQATR